MSRGHENKKWDYDSVREVALQFNRKRDFDLAYGGAVAWARRHGVFEDVTSHMQKFTIWDFDAAMSEAKKHSNRTDFNDKAAGCVKWLQRNDLYDKACEHMDQQFIWTEDLVRSEALKYSTRVEFREANSSATQWATRNGKMDEVCSHMKPVVSWDYESVSEEALKYDSREDFRQNSSGAACWAVRNGVFDAVCLHMNLYSRCDYDCVYIWKPSGFGDVYKIGVTSKRLGTKRIDHVSGNYGFEVEFLQMKACPDALKKEKLMLSFGQPAKMCRDYDGFSEFRHLSDGEFLSCLNIMDVSIAEATT